MKSLAVNEQKKVLDLQEFFCTINVSNKHLIGVKESIVRLLKELVKDKIIHNQLEILSNCDAAMASSNLFSVSCLISLIRSPT
jgi:hypothetical protein